MTATDELRELLSEDWKPATEIRARMEAAGYSVDEARTARRRLGVTQVLGGVRFIDGHWHWRLPPDGCVTCGRSWGADGYWRSEYWANRPSTPASHGAEDEISHGDEPSAPALSPSQPTRYKPAGPPVCSVCGRASAMPAGSQCPFQSSTGVRCMGTMQ
jgi:hypothetical protein